MSGPPPGSGACCAPRSQGITSLTIGDVTVGMVGLETVFRQLTAMGRRPEEASDAELVGMARASNWIPHKPAVEAEYGSALRGAYRAYVARQEGSRDRSTG